MFLHTSLSAMHLNSSQQLLSHIKPDAFNFTFKEKGVVTECRNYYCIGKDDSFVLIQATFSTIGFSNSIQVSAMCYCPKYGLNILQSENYSASKMILSKERTSLVIGPLSIINEGGGVTNISYEEKDNLKILLKVSYEQEPFQFGDGKVVFGKEKSDGSVHSKFAASCRINGLISHSALPHKQIPFEGIGTILHVTQGIKPHHAMNRTWFAYFTENPPDSNDTTNDSITNSMGYSVTLIDVETPTQYRNQHYKYAFVSRGAEIVALSRDIRATSEKHNICSLSGYKVPNDFVYSMNGIAINGEHFEAQIKVEDCNIIGTIDVLGKLTSVIKLFIKTFIAKPFLYQWFNKRAELKLTIGNTIHKCFGTLFHEHSILHDSP